MVSEWFERYAVTACPEGLHIRMRQALNCVGSGVLALGMLAASWLGGAPASGVGWAWIAFWALYGTLAAVGALRKEDWLISDGKIRYRNSSRRKERCFRRSSGKPLTLRVKALPRDPDAIPHFFPHVAHLIGPDGEEIGDGFAFQRRSSLDRFLETLCLVLPLDVDDQRPRKGGADGPRKPPPALADRWLD